MAHVVSNSQPPNGALGDEWFNPTTNKLYKLVALSGTNVSWQDVGNIVTGTNTGTGTSTTIVTSQVIANVEYTFTARQNYTGNTTATAVKFWNAAEQMSISGISPGSAGNATIQIDLATAAVYYFTTAATGNWTVNFRMSPGTFLNSGMGNNESVSAVVMATQGSSPYYSNATQIDGVTVTPKWQDGITPIAGNASSVDIYNYTIIKTANATYTVLGSQSRFA
jgi:hypothetical protein